MKIAVMLDDNDLAELTDLVRTESRAIEEFSHYRPSLQLALDYYRDLLKRLEAAYAESMKGEPS